MTKFKKLLATDAVTFPPKVQIKAHVNLNLFIATFAAANQGQWLINADFVKAARQNGIVNSNYVINSSVRDLSGNEPSLIAEAQRDVLIREEVTNQDRLDYGWDGSAKFKYRFNPQGKMRFRPAKRTMQVMNITKAKMLVKIK